MSKQTKHGEKQQPTSPQASSIDTTFQQAQALHRSGQAQQAATLYQQVLSTQPDHFDTLTMYAMLMCQHGKNEVALQLMSRALEVNPAAPATWLNRGNVLTAMGRFEEALADYNHALELSPDYPTAHYNQGCTLQQLNRDEEALASYDRALELKRDYADAWNNRANTLMRLGRPEEALPSFERALHYKPDFAMAHYNRGNVLRDLERFEDALASYDRALMFMPNYAEAHYNRGNLLRELGRYEEALASLARAQAISPDHASAHYNEAFCRLLLGDYALGWQKYEWRWKSVLKKENRPFPQPLWLGHEGIAGKTILLHAEQGFGDTIQFCRYAAHVTALGAKVLLEVPSQLVSLISTLEGPAKVLTQGEPLPEFDYHTPLMSLPLACTPTLGTTIPAQTPYLSPPPEKLTVWRDKVGADEGVRVGLVWSGSTGHKNDRNRSILLAELSPILELPQITFVSLQKEVRDHDRAVLSQFAQLQHYGVHLQDFADTAALIATLDLVITVDTAVAHLAGALGKPVWILLSQVTDWRWLLKGAESPWYPTARLYRQLAAGDWKSVAQKIAEDLGHFGCDQNN